MSSAAVVTGTLRVKTKISLNPQISANKRNQDSLFVSTCNYIADLHVLFVYTSVPHIKDTATQSRYKC